MGPVDAEPLPLAAADRRPDHPSAARRPRVLVADDYLEKPFSARELLARVTANLGMARLRRKAADALREGEGRLRSLVEGMPHPVWRADAAGGWTWASPQWTAYTGPAEAASHDQGWMGAVHPDDRNAVPTAWQQAMASSAFRADHRLYHAVEGRYRWVQSQALPLRDQMGCIVEWLGTITDERTCGEPMSRISSLPNSSTAAATCLRW
jgi:PAS domain S-box-containing protein